MHNRKDDHVKYALEQFNHDSSFESMHLQHDALPNLNLNEINLRTNIESLELEFPFYINAMTGGSAKTKEINKDLSEVARQLSIPIASGSLSAALKDPSQKDSFEILREVNPNGLIFANIGAEYSVDKALEAINIIQADALQVHLNIIQEVVMEEGDREFNMWSQNIKDIIEAVDVPVIVKEVGFGMSEASLNKLVKLGVKNIDVSGKGGTNFAKIENDRRKLPKYPYLNDFGLTTIESLVVAKNINSDATILASGGVKTPLDIVKCIILGANAVGVSGAILNSVTNDGVEKTVNLLQEWIEEIKVIMLVLGCKDIQALQNYKGYTFK